MTSIEDVLYCLWLLVTVKSQSNPWISGVNVGRGSERAALPTLLQIFSALEEDDSFSGAAEWPTDRTEGCTGHLPGVNEE